ncbi:lanthionine synthetase LanC family protein [Flavobacterium sp. ZB4P13]|uniref:lanthionine synthetase LanC family protein n=1 Tax=Flavobacterium sp. ZB4P13 TaxID=3401728 RepID=UPI003AAC59F0
MESLQENKINILSRVEDFSNLILDLTFEQLIEVSEKNNTKLNQYLLSNNIENIETGVSGFLLFLLEMYKFTKKDIYLEKAELLSKNTISYCEKTATNNYSLYRGRAGLIYVLIQLYDINKNVDLLQVSEDLIIQSENEYLESKYTSDYLYDGRSGTLLVLNELFQRSKSERILGILNKFIYKIVNNALFTEKGISWKATEEINLKNSCGFALGSSGIQYVFKNLNIDFPNNHLDYIIKYIDKHKLSCWDEQHQSWLNFEKDITNSIVLNQFKLQYLDNDSMLYNPTNELNWSKGSIGILLSENQNKKIFFELDNYKINNLPSNIYDGLSGIGLSLLENHSMDNRERYLSLIKDEILGQQNQTTLNGGLFFGDLGESYFLLKTLTYIEYPDNIIKPFKIKNQTVNKCDLSIDIRYIKKSLLSKVYDKTLLLIENIFDLELCSFLDNLEYDINKSEIRNFEDFVFKTFIKVDSNINRVIEDVFIFEKRKKKYVNQELKTNLQIFLDKLHHNEKIVRILNNSDEWILNQELKISEHIKIVNTKWDWEFREKHSFVHNFYNEPSNNEFIFINTFKNFAIEYPLRIDGLVLHRFDSQKKVKDALFEIKEYCKSQSEEMIKDFLETSGSKDIEDFIKRLDFLILHNIKQLLYDNILKLV